MKRQHGLKITAKGITPNWFPKVLPALEKRQGRRKQESQQAAEQRDLITPEIVQKNFSAAEMAGTWNRQAAVENTEAQEILRAAEDKITRTGRDREMSKLQKQANTAWYALFNIGLAGYCTEDTMDDPRCCSCPEPEKAPPTCDWKRAVFLKNWLRNNGFPLTEPHVYTVAELAQQIIMGRSLPCLTQQITQYVEAATCPGCGKHTLHRERRMVCTGCNSVYPADKWANGEPCDCGCMDARYYGIHSANRLGQLEFQRCETPGCRWGGDYRRLTVQELADVAQEEADEQLAAARTCPACGEASGNDQLDGVCLPIESCECGWRRG